MHSQRQTVDRSYERLLTLYRDSKEAAAVACRTERSWRPPSSRCQRMVQLRVSPAPTATRRTTTEHVAPTQTFTLRYIIL